MIVTLPWPDKRLSPNARMHWAALAKVKQEARQNAHWAVLADVPANYREQVVEGDGKIPLEITFYPPDNRRRDDDNMVASFKAYRDGLADGLFVDDRRFRPHYIFADAEKPGRIEVFIPNYRTDTNGAACPPCVCCGKGERPDASVSALAPGLTTNRLVEGGRSHGS